MLTRRETKLDWISAFVYRLLPLPPELQRINELFPEDKILEVASAFYDGDLGRPSEDPILLTKMMFLSFFYDITGDKNTLLTLTYRLDWRQFCGLSLFAPLPDRTTLVKFRRRVGSSVIDTLFEGFVQTLMERGCLINITGFLMGRPPKRVRVSTPIGMRFMKSRWRALSPD
ncbi:MAG: transposase [bacterium]|nr:transposase [bacterium]